MSLPLVPGIQRSFSTLPDDIKVEILRHRLMVPSPLTYRTHIGRCVRLLLPLARVNRGLGFLATEVYYADNTVLIHGAINPSVPLLRFPKPALGVWIRHLEIHLRAIDESGFPYWYDDKPWKPEETKQISNFLEQGDVDGIVVGYAPTVEDMARDGRLQLPHFPSLKSLKLSLDFEHYERVLDYSHFQKSFFETVGKRERAVLRAKSIEVVFRGCEEMLTPRKMTGAQFVATIVADLKRICNGDKEDAKIGRVPRGLRILSR